jgi:DNA polymerase V
MLSGKKDEVMVLIDCNSFYCSCERLFQPRLAQRPVVVLSNNDGCVVSRTNEAKALGIPMGAPYHQYKDVIIKNNVAVFSSNYTMYGDISQRVMNTLRQFSPEMEIYSIDEAFLSLKGFRNLSHHVEQIKTRVWRDVGIPVSVGVGPTKVLAKVANKIGKKEGRAIQLLDSKSQSAALKNFPVEDLWGVGRRSANKLFMNNIKTAAQLRDANEKFIQRLMTIQGRRIVRELKGESCISLELLTENKKNIATTRTFGRPVFRLEDLQEAVACHASTCAEKLRQQNGLARKVLVFIHTNPHKNTPQYSNSGTIKLLSGTSYTPKLIKAAFHVLRQIYKPGIEYKKCGVIISDIRPKEQNQLDFFSSHDSPKEDGFMGALDKINRWHGPWTAKMAACGIHKDWKMLSQMRSPCRTTRWSDLLVVK